ncbi:mono/diheme cytochrome c family protein [Mesorhizobium soli]|uniref:c-type cytochrome n=1 Tax=Pseudaminobacter soli (ex Li et al. 2025) TaxID=1295366 RepID=UPI0024751FBA|nr:cytochrome c [Mesorhizobium soli]MDH6231868.1 mono/diheme cytochrome c family protein [Mesorhizobium soli]
MKTEIFGVFVLLVVASSPASLAAAQERPNGQEEFSTYCASCHGISGRGNGLLAELLVKKPADLTVLTKNNGGRFPLDRVIATIDGRAEVAEHGAREMPVWGKIFRSDHEASNSAVTAEDRILALAYFIRSIQQR